MTGSIPQKTEYGVKLGDVEILWARNSKEFFFSNSLLIRDTHTTVVDPSSNFTFFEHLASQKIVQWVLNTHYHVDHRSLNHLFPHARFMCHKLDEKPISSFENYLRYADSQHDSSYVQWLQGIFSTLGIMEGYVSVPLRDNELLPLKGQSVRAIHLPGHTPGHLGLYFEDIGLFYSSDIDLTPLGPWYANISSEIDEFINSIERVKSIHCRYYATSHGGRLYDEEIFKEKLEKFASAFEKRDTRILEVLEIEPQTLEEISSIGIIFKSSHLSDPLKACFERQMIEKHLQRFERQGKVHRDQNLWVMHR